MFSVLILVYSATTLARKEEAPRFLPTSHVIVYY
jgi:hypothetical protein